MRLGTGVVQRQRLRTYEDPDQPFAFPRIHALVFDPATGLMKKLPIDFKKHIGEYKHIYDLYDMPKEEFSEVQPIAHPGALVVRFKLKTLTRLAEAPLGLV